MACWSDDSIVRWGDVGRRQPDDFRQLADWIIWGSRGEDDALDGRRSEEDVSIFDLPNSISSTEGQLLEVKGTVLVQ